MRTTVAVIGGGLAGLSAARLLHASGIDFRLLEARRRLGGRILSVDATGEPSADGFDLGPSWFWPDMHPVMADIAGELGLRHFAQHSDGDVVVERIGHEPPRRFRTMRQEPESMRFEGGTGALVAALAKALSRERLRTGMRVTHITLDDKGVALTITASDGSAGLLSAEQVILALPPRLLAETITFEPAIEPEIAARWRNTATWMAPHAKFFALYDRPFWREAGLSGTAQSALGPLVEIHDATTASGGAALFGFLGVDAARRASIGEDVLVRASVVQLARLFGPDAAHPRATLFKDWAADSLTATARDRSAGEHPIPDRRPWISGKWQKHIFLAGSETSSTAPGYLAGAIEAAERAVAGLTDRVSAVKASASGDRRDGAMKRTYRAMQVTTPGTLELVERDVPTPGPGEVLIAVEACGICGADAADIEGADPSQQPPRVPGHEVVGRIVALGEGVPSLWKPGQRVGVGRLGGHCSECAQCRQGLFQLCRNQPVLGASSDGGYAEMMVARGTGLVSIPDELSSEEAAPILCAGIATFNALKKCGAAAGDLVAVFGIGGLGHMALQYARRMGFKVAAVGRGQDIAKDALELGAHLYIDTDKDDAAGILTSMGGAVAVIATIGNAAAVSALIGGRAAQGRLVLLGAGKDPLAVSTGLLVRGERSVVGSITGSPYENERAMDFTVLTGVRPRIETMALERAFDAYRRMKSGDVKFRMVLTMGETGHAH